MTNQVSHLDCLPIELVDRVVSFVNSYDSRDTRFDSSEIHIKIKNDLLSLSRVEAVGGRIMMAAEKKLCQSIHIEDFEQVELLAEFKIGDKRLDYVKGVMIKLNRQLEDYPVVEGMKQLNSFLRRIKKLSTLVLEIHHDIWKELKPSLHFLLDISVLELKVYRFISVPNGDYSDQDSEFSDFSLDSDAEDQTRYELVDCDITIADIPSLLSLKEITYNTRSEFGSLSYFLNLGQEIIRENLKSLRLPYWPYTYVSPLFHLLPSLAELYTGNGNEQNILSSLPPSLRKLMFGTPIHNMAEQLRNLKDKPFFLTHLVINCLSNFDFSALPFIPPSVQVLSLTLLNLERLVVALEKIQLGELHFRVLRVEKDYGKEQFWDRIADQCKRLEIELVESSIYDVNSF